jgi:transcriptional regulator with XRE-family HTH domain
MPGTGPGGVPPDAHGAPMSNAFGEMLREKRLEQRRSLREFSMGIGLDPSNYSKIERGVLPPPVDDGFGKIAEGLGLIPGSQEWERLLFTAEVDRREIPGAVLANEEVAAALPAFFQKLKDFPVSSPGGMYDLFLDAVRER